MEQEQGSACPPFSTYVVRGRHEIIDTDQTAISTESDHNITGEKAGSTMTMASTEPSQYETQNKEQVIRAREGAGSTTMIGFCGVEPA